MNRLPDFYQLSANLTGYDHAHLKATGVGEQYYDVLTTVVAENILDKLFDCYNQLHNEYEGNVPSEPLRTRILANQTLGPVARNIIKMWYLSIWYQLPEHWRQCYGTPNQSPDKYQDKEFVVSRDAYIQGLVWQTLGSHPMGAKQPGYGTWAYPPEKDGPIPVNLQ